MDPTKKMPLTYADILRESLGHKPAHSPKSWFQEIDESENVQMSRSNSQSTILSDDTIATDTRSRVKRLRTSHSVDSGQVSDISSDNESCQKWYNVTDSEDVLQRRKSLQMQLHRRTSVDSCHTSSSTCCTDSNCSSDHNQLQLMCQRWQSVKHMQKERESDEGVLARRQKQIDYGKNTTGYKLYTKQVSIDERTENHPKTPNMHRKYSRRAFDGLIKIWRKKLHLFDPDCSEASDDQSQKSDDPAHNTDRTH